jgi:hypothetical protein
MTLCMDGIHGLRQTRRPRDTKAWFLPLPFKTDRATGLLGGAAGVERHPEFSFVIWEQGGRTGSFTASAAWANNYSHFFDTMKASGGPRRGNQTFERVDLVPRLSFLLFIYSASSAFGSPGFYGIYSSCLGRLFCPSCIGRGRP